MRTYRSVAGAHALALLSKLNVQRMEGKFCDCVIRQHRNPGKLYLAHKSVLAASSPVLASLLPSKSALLELQFPSTTTDVLGSLLDFIYTGTVPPADPDGSFLSAATYLQIEELQQALRNSRQDTSSESDCIVAADMKTTLRGEKSDQQQNIDSTQFPLSCEVVPVICHASKRKKHSLVSETQPQSYVMNNVSDLTSNKTGVTTFKVTTGQRQHLKQSYVKEEEEVEQGALYDSPPEYRRILSAGSPVPDLPSVVPEDAACYSDELHNDEKFVFPMSGYVVPTHAVACAETQTEDFSENGINEEFAPHVKSSSHDGRIPIRPNLPLTSRCIEGFSTLDQLDFDNDKPYEGHLTQQCENISDANECILDNSEEGHMYICSSQVPSAYYPKDNMTKSCRSASKSNLWTKALRYSTTHPKSSEELALKESGRKIKGSVTNATEMQMYQGQVCYRYLGRKKTNPVQSSDSDDDGLFSSMARSDLRGGLGLTVEANVSDCVLLDIPAERPPAGHAGSNHSQLSFMTPGSGPPYRCTMCDRAFSQRGSLNRHMRSHLGVRPYPCPQCPMTFSRQYRVTEHMRVHQRGSEDFQRTDAI